MKSQLYTNIVLTAIALLLLISILQDGMSRKDVRIVAIARPNKAQMQKARVDSQEVWSDLPVSGDVIVDGSVDVNGSVDIGNEPVKVKIQQ